MKLFAATILFFLSASLLAQQIPVPFSLADVAYPILGMKKSPSSRYLFLTLAGGRFLLYDLSKGKLDENSKVLFFSTEGDTDKENYKRVVWEGACVKPQ